MVIRNMCFPVNSKYFSAVKYHNSIIQNISILFVSHKLREIREICKTITIMRNGEVVADGRVEDYDEAKITRYMTGRDIGAAKFKYAAVPNAKPILEVNPAHPVFKVLSGLPTDDPRIAKYAGLLYDQALLIEGLPLEDPVAFSNGICELMV